ncbi:hypothetical protein TIFTF001_023124 [Ficus carica]|uniref:Uncharacterized protein n=1 Tax=Ficus carica TaxID=3494 RepID=A0AA88AE20_FICCA|nr:hypothetical protein TIFTF001_023124 [Ficus carica]
MATMMFNPPLVLESLATTMITTMTGAEILVLSISREPFEEPGLYRQSTPRAKAVALKTGRVKAKTGCYSVGIGGCSTGLQILGSQLWTLQRQNVKAAVSVKYA